MEQSVAEQRPVENPVIQQIQSIGGNMTGWLKFLGVMFIIAGAMYAVTIVGIIIAWIPVWMGVLLLQAGSRAGNARFSQNSNDIVVMMDKLRLFFVIMGILTIISIAITIISFAVFGSFFSQMMSNMQQF